MLDDERGTGKYDTVVIYDHHGQVKAYAEDMPIFVLLAQDRLAAIALEAYAAGLAAVDLVEQADDVKAFALRVRRWQEQNPDRVKLPD